MCMNYLILVLIYKNLQNYFKESIILIEDDLRNDNYIILDDIINNNNKCLQIIDDINKKKLGFSSVSNKYKYLLYFNISIINNKYILIVDIVIDNIEYDNYINLEIDNLKTLIDYIKTTKLITNDLLNYHKKVICNYNLFLQIFYIEYTYISKTLLLKNDDLTLTVDLGIPKIIYKNFPFNKYKNYISNDNTFNIKCIHENDLVYDNKYRYIINSTILRPKTIDTSFFILKIRIKFKSSKTSSYYCDFKINIVYYFDNSYSINYEGDYKYLNDSPTSFLNKLFISEFIKSNNCSYFIPFKGSILIDYIKL